MTTITLTVNKKDIHLQPTRMSIYKQSEIVEAIDKKQNSYYLVFYKYNFLNGIRANKIVLNSHVHKAFTQGITFDANHPLTQALLSKHQHYSHSRFNPLLKKIQQKYSPSETALIFTFFDSFIPKGELNKLIKKLYYQYRRNGQLLAAFKILKIYQMYDNEDTFPKSMLNNLQFQSYQVMYQDLDKLKKTDSIYLESVCFDSYHHPSYAKQLFDLYQEQGRWMDELALRLKQFTNITKDQDFILLQNLIQEHFEPHQQVHLLTSLVEQADQHTLVRQHLLDLALTHGTDEEIIHTVLTSEIRPSQDQLPKIAASFSTAKPEILHPYFHSLNKKILSMFAPDYKLLESTVNHCVIAFFNNYRLETIIDWFAPFHDAGIPLPIEKKLAKMKALEDDPDGQCALGQLYQEFNQYERSIDCFKWEMELNPTNPEPVKSLTKAYQQLGREKEADAYQQLLIQMKK
ncbi:tetratricopeptide repeat protein [Aquibacillus sediminis]|uniref:tetratricopeptide repeat protein n=1 Tax=Aquibacillus sediminis TaxID=2574734 RepID=UPI0011099ABF|nr:hypothetical protein [Aquibacillus sediminis]